MRTRYQPKGRRRVLYAVLVVSTDLRTPMVIFGRCYRERIGTIILTVNVVPGTEEITIASQIVALESF